MKKSERSDAVFSENENQILELKKRIKDLETLNKRHSREKEDLVNNENLFFQYFRQCPVQLFIKDNDLRVIKLSKSFEKMFGIPSNLIEGKKMNEVFPSKFAKKIISDDKKVLKSNKPTELFEEFNGSRYLTVKFPLKIKGKTPQLAGLTMDFSKYFLMQEALHESRSRYQELLELAVDGILIGSKDGYIIDANSTICKMTGHSRKELLGRHIAESFFSQESISEKPFQFDDLRKGKIVLNERVIVRTDGREIPIEMRTKMMPDGTFQSIYRDISERKKAEKELLQLSQDKDRFISILSHDLKSPFNSLIALSKLLTNNIQTYDIDKIDGFLKQFSRSAQNTYELMEDLLGWARAQSGKMSFKPQYLNFPDLCEVVFDSFNCNISYSGVKFIYSGKKDLSVYADADMLKTILRNLVSNAVKFIKKEGKVEIDAIVESNLALITVKDNGIGIESSDVKKLFDVMGVRTIPDANGDKGTGFGLLLCKEFVEKHNGMIWAESELGKGSEFKFFLPLI